VLVNKKFCFSVGDWFIVCGSERGGRMPLIENQSYQFRLERRAQILLAFYYGHVTEEPATDEEKPTCRAWYKGKPQYLSAIQKAHMFAGDTVRLQLHGGPMILATVNFGLAIGDSAGTIESVIALEAPLLSRAGRELAELVYAAHVIMPGYMSVEEARHYGDRARVSQDLTPEKFRNDLQEMLDARAPLDVSHIRDDYEGLQRDYGNLLRMAQKFNRQKQELETELARVLSSQNAEDKAEPVSRERFDRPGAVHVVAGVPAIQWIEVGRTNQNMPIYKIPECRVLDLERNGRDSALVYEHGGLVYRIEARHPDYLAPYRSGDTTIYFVRFARRPFLTKPV
jgi:hypothetical protein